MSDAKVSACRGKSFDPRPDTPIETIEREMFDRRFAGGMTVPTVTISLARVRWLERPDVARSSK